jgi:hypothetical protein
MNGYHLELIGENDLIMRSVENCAYLCFEVAINFISDLQWLYLILRIFVNKAG